MWSSIWHTFFFDPVYNVLVFFIDVLPAGDVGLAIVATVVFIKMVMLPLSIKVAKMQVVMKEIEPRLKKIKSDIKDRQEQAQAMMELYKEAGINPLASILLIFIQFPIIIAIYLAVSTGGGVALPEINTALLYSYIPTPNEVSMMMLGVFDITTKSLPLALLAGVTMFFQVRLTMPKLEPKTAGAQPNFKEDFTRSMQLQMRYVMPILITVFAYILASSIALYFVVSNLVAIAQELFVRRHRKTPDAKTES